MPRAIITLDNLEAGETVEIHVRRRVDRTPAGPGLAAAGELVDAEGEPLESWRVVDLAAARARRAG